MGHRVWKDPYVSINAVELSSHVVSVRPNRAQVFQDDLAGGQTLKYYLAGTDDLTFDIEFAQDFAASQVDATLRGIHGTAVAVALRQNKTAAISTTNPEYQATCLIDYQEPLGGTMNERETTRVRVLPTTVWTIDVTP